MTEGHVTAAESTQAFGIEHIRNQSVSLVMREDTVIIDGDTAGFLASVLQCVESQIDGLCSFTGPVFKDTEYTAFFVQ